MTRWESPPGTGEGVSEGGDTGTLDAPPGPAAEPPSETSGVSDEAAPEGLDARDHSRRGAGVCSLWPASNAWRWSLVDLRTPVRPLERPLSATANEIADTQDGRGVFDESCEHVLKRFSELRQRRSEVEAGRSGWIAKYKKARRRLGGAGSSDSNAAEFLEQAGSRAVEHGRLCVRWPRPRPGRSVLESG